MVPRRVNFGIAIPQVFPSCPVDMAVVRDFIVKAESLGYDSLWVQDMIVGEVGILEPVSLLNYAAAITSKVRLGTSMLLPVMRSPIMLAKVLASLDQMSHGRLTLGIALGGNDRLDLFGIPRERRVRRFIEAYQVIKTLWTESSGKFSGTFFTFDDVSMEPKPVQTPHPPIWIGGRTAPGLKRAAKYGDGWMGGGSSSTAMFIEQVKLLKGFLDEMGRDPINFPVSKRVYIAVDDNHGRVEARLRQWFGARYQNPEIAMRVVWGNRAECIDKIAEIVDGGAKHIMLNPVFAFREHLEVLAQDIMPRV